MQVFVKINIISDIIFMSQQLYTVTSCSLYQKIDYTWDKYQSQVKNTDTEKRKNAF